MATLEAAYSFSLLIVEDDKAACDIISRMVALKFPGCTIYTAENGMRGLDLFKEHTPDIVITDVNMPVMDGIELAREISAITEKATYIVVTAYSSKIVLEKFQDIGICAYLLKPINFEELFAAIERCTIESKAARG